MNCFDCGCPIKRSSVRCLDCSIIHQKEIGRIYSQKKRDNSTKLTKIYNFNCKYCSVDFETVYKQQIFCSDICKHLQKNKEINERWLKRDLKSIPRKEGQFIEYSRVKEKKGQGWLKKYNHIRG